MEGGGNNNKSRDRSYNRGGPNIILNYNNSDRERERERL